MVPVDADTCIDRFELQHTIPLGSNPQAGVVPDENIKPLSMRLSCQGNNKRLCTLEELADACSNGGAQMYPYGNTFEATSCGSMSVHPTASLSECQSENGAFDLVGNVWETAAFTGSSGTTYIFGGDFRGSTAATGSCCIRTEAGDPYPAGCEQFFDDLDAFKGANISQVEVNALTHTQDILGNPISLGYRCCQDL